MCCNFCHSFMSLCFFYVLTRTQSRMKRTKVKGSERSRQHKFHFHFILRRIRLKCFGIYGYKKSCGGEPFRSFVQRKCVLFEHIQFLVKTHMLRFYILCLFPVFLSQNFRFTPFIIASVFIFSRAAITLDNEPIKYKYKMFPLRPSATAHYPIPILHFLRFYL